jgi:D-alanyl-D-alanine carboxypeptidase
MEHAPKEYIFKISKEALGEAGDNKLLVDERFTRDELLKFALVESSNDAFYQMANDVGTIIDPTSKEPRQVFISKMNEKAEALNLRSAHFKSPSGLDITPHDAGAYASARDVAKLFAYAYETYPDIFVPTIKNAPEISSLDVKHIAKNTNPVVEEIPNILASKTGFTSISGGNLAVILKGRNNHTLVVVVLGSTFDERFKDVAKISGALSESTNN